MRQVMIAEETNTGSRLDIEVKNKDQIILPFEEPLLKEETILPKLRSTKFITSTDISHGSRVKTL